MTLYYAAFRHTKYTTDTKLSRCRWLLFIMVKVINTIPVTTKQVFLNNNTAKRFPPLIRKALASLKHATDDMIKKNVLAQIWLMVSFDQALKYRPIYAVTLF
jgi:hypothetical protein